MDYHFTISEPFAILFYNGATMRNYLHGVCGEYATEADAIADYVKLDCDAGFDYALATRDENGYASPYEEKNLLRALDELAGSN